MEITIQEVEEYFESPFTADIWKELWSKSKELEENDAIGWHCDGRLISVEAAYWHVKSDQEAFEECDLYSECHGCDQFLANLQNVEFIRFGLFNGRWVTGCVVAHPTEPFVLAIYFCVLKVPRVYISDIQKVEEYFASPSTVDDIKALWADFKGFKALEGPSNFKRVRISGKPLSAPYIRGVWQGRTDGIKRTGDCYGDEQYLRHLQNAETVRVGGVDGERIHSVIAAHAEEPFIIGFFFWVVRPN